MGFPRANHWPKHAPATNDYLRALASGVLQLRRPMLDTDDQRILVSQALPGMVLSRAVSMQSHMVLCAAGTELNEALIARLAERGVKRVWVKGHPLPPPDPEDYLLFVERLRRRFSRCSHDPAMRELLTVVERGLARRM